MLLERKLDSVSEKLGATVLLKVFKKKRGGGGGGRVPLGGER